MTIEDELKQYIVTKYGTLTKFGEKVGLSQSTLSTIFKRGFQRTSITRIFKICDELGISADALALGKIIPKADYGLKVENVLEAFSMMRNQVRLAIDDVPITDFEFFMLQHNLTLTIEVLRKRRHEIEMTTGKSFDELSDFDRFLAENNPSAKDEKLMNDYKELEF